MRNKSPKQMYAKIASILLLVLAGKAIACPDVHDVSFQLAARAFDSDWIEIKAQACTENSTLDPKVKSSAGAVGCGQFLPSTWEWLEGKWSLDGWEIDDCTYSIWMLTAYFNYHYQYFLDEGLKPPEAKEFAWAAYNRGKGGVLRTIKNVGKGFLWSAVRSHLPLETREYSRKIKSLAVVLRRRK